MKLSDLYLMCLSFAVIFYYAIVVVYFPQLYIFFTYEDLYGEWIQVFFFFATFIFSSLNTLNASKGHYRWFFLLLAIASFYTFMEEISWGQRILDLVSPEFFIKHSYQKEINFHNLFTGPTKSWTKTTLTYLISIAFLGYGVLFPITLKLKWKLSIFFNQRGLVAPPIALLPAFLVASICEMEFFFFNEAEVAELLIAMAMAFTAFNFWLTNKKISLSSIKIVSSFILLTLAVSGSAYATTQLLLNLPNQQKKIESRLSNGYKKFANRYERFDHYPAIIEVLTLYNAIRPNSTTVLRRIASNYKQLNQPEKANEFLNQAITVALKRNTKRPHRVSTLLSLAKSYHALEQSEKAINYAKQARAIASKKIKRKRMSHKNRAYWYYWLASADDQLNKPSRALKYYYKAYKILPHSKRYKQAYYKKRNLMKKAS